MRWRGLWRRWTLGGLMVLIAALAVLLSIYGRHARDEEARQVTKVRATAELNVMLDGLNLAPVGTEQAKGPR